MKERMKATERQGHVSRALFVHGTISPRQIQQYIIDKTGYTPSINTINKDIDMIRKEGAHFFESMATGGKELHTLNMINTISRGIADLQDDIAYLNSTAQATPPDLEKALGSIEGEKEGEYIKGAIQANNRLDNLPKKITAYKSIIALQGTLRYLLGTDKELSIMGNEPIHLSRAAHILRKYPKPPPKEPTGDDYRAHITDLDSEIKEYEKDKATIAQNDYERGMYQSMIDRSKEARKEAIAELKAWESKATPPDLESTKAQD